MSEDLQTKQTLASLYPTRIERVLERLVTAAYRINEYGITGWIGDRADDLRVWLQKRRAARS